MLAFIMAAGFIADSASLPFKISNLVNIIAANYAGIGFNDYATVMVWVNLLSVVVSLWVLFWYFRKDIPLRYEMTDLSLPQNAIRDPLIFHAGWLVLAGLMIGYVLSQHWQIPTSFITGAGALVLVLLAGREHFAGRQAQAVIPIVTLIRGAPWQVVIFSLGMYLVVYGLRNQGITGELTRILTGFSHQGLLVTTLVTGFIMAILSAVMNNLPAVLAGSLAIAQTQTSPLLHQAMIYANVIGCDLGPKITPIGSLATLLWLHILAQRGIKIGWGQYFRIGIVLTVPVLLVVLLGLAGVLALGA